MAGCRSMGSFILLCAFMTMPRLSLAEDCSVKRDGAKAATVRGIVKENIDKCSVDLSCYLILACQSINITIVYAPAEGSAVQAINSEAFRTASKVKPGDLVEAYGAGGVNSKGAGIEIYSNNSYWIKVVR